MTFNDLVLLFEARHSEDYISSILSDYNADMPIGDIVRKYKTTAPSINSILDGLRKKGILQSRRRAYLSQEEKDSIVADYKAGMKRADIQKKYDISDNVISRYINKTNVSSRLPRDFQRFSPEQKKEIFDMARKFTIEDDVKVYEHGYKQIADHINSKYTYNTSSGAIFALIKRVDPDLWNDRRVSCTRGPVGKLFIPKSHLSPAKRRENKVTNYSNVVNQPSYDTAFGRHKGETQRAQIPNT